MLGSGAGGGGLSSSTCGRGSITGGATFSVGAGESLTSAGSMICAGYEQSMHCDASGLQIVGWKTGWQVIGHFLQRSQFGAQRAAAQRMSAFQPQRSQSQQQHPLRLANSTSASALPADRVKALDNSRGSSPCYRHQRGSRLHRSRRV